MLGQLGIVVTLLVLGFIFGRIAERRHYKSIIKREHEFNALPAIASRYPPREGHYKQQLVTGSVVVSSDYFKSFIAGLINLFGGSVVSFESLLDRARREAVLRMKAEAKEQGAELVFNVKYETMPLGSSRVGSVEVLAYGTALRRGG